MMNPTIMPTRFDYRCQNCGHGGELRLPMTSAATPRKCPTCGKRQYRRQFTLNPNALDVATMHCAYANRFPYVSHSMPFKGNLAGGGKHVGPMGKILVESASHEERLRRVHGMVGENQIGQKVA